MGYFMVHLHVAREVARRRGGIRDEAAYYRGALAPDAIMFHPGARRSDKWDAHFCVGDGGWGMTTDDAAWRANILPRIRALRGAAGDDFLLGYFTHVWADTWNNELLWTPARLAEADAPGTLAAYERDEVEIDSILLSELEDRDRLWALLKRPCRDGLPFATAEDTDLLVEAMIGKMYADREPVPGYVFTIVTPDEMRALIDGAAGDILDQIDQNDLFS